MNKRVQQNHSWGERTGRWMKKNLFSNKLNTIITLILLCLLAKLLGTTINWIFLESVWQGNAEDCRLADGACMAFIVEKARFILFGLYPTEELWRPILATALFFSLIWYSKERHRWGKRLIKPWLVGIPLIALLMQGNFLGLSHVESSLWGGLQLTLLLSFVGLIFSYPLGILLALGRQSRLPFMRWICVSYIELIRGVPLISLLFMSSVMFPFLLPDGVSLDKLLRAQVAIIMFISAYMAEVVRGGLAAINKGQYEAADALALNTWQKTRFIILPQALKIVIPPTVNTMMGMFKDTSLVAIIGLFDLLLTTKTALTDSNWQGFSVEAYLFVALIYFVLCFSVGRYTRGLEKDLSTS